jgi:tetraacyldisaccharide 4'-kinase
VRNKFFDWGILKSQTFNTPVINIGNLNVGGTGKTPHTQWIVGLLKADNKVAVLSRGYGRKTKGFLLANEKSTAAEIGDEPLETLSRHPEITLAVCEKRADGIEELERQEASPELILLDDAYQHRYVKPGLNILLTAYADLFADDLILPAGNLRESKAGKERADIIIVTKCPEQLAEAKKETISEKLKLSSTQTLGFSNFKYGSPINLKGEEQELPGYFILVTGIAQTDYLLDYLNQKDSQFHHVAFKDHHNFSTKDYAQIFESCNGLGTNKILTTSKDSMRLDHQLLKENNIEVLQLPIEVNFLSGKENIEAKIKEFVSVK